MRPSRGSVWVRRREESRSSGESVVEASLHGGDKRRKSSFFVVLLCSRECGYECLCVCRLFVCVGRRGTGGEGQREERGREEKRLRNEK